MPCSISFHLNDHPTSKQPTRNVLVSTVVDKSTEQFLSYRCPWGKELDCSSQNKLQHPQTKHLRLTYGRR
ncbi:unnamed protein product [Rhizophagus irregularis]|nr:unnamed protein product [Rhizophagus irregularis]